MNFFKKHITRSIILLLALQILNLSVQSRPTIDTNDSFLLGHSQMANPIDSALEYIVERLMNKKDAFPEDGREKHQDPIHLEKTTSYNLYFAYYDIHHMAATLHPVVLTHKDAYQEGYNYLFASEINPPPPRA